ncbi:MAG TPA: glycine zipper 2TM domain-containing protein [Noviherbaspirillum sp.]
MNKFFTRISAAILGTALLAACASPDYYGQRTSPSYPVAFSYPASPAPSSSYGTVDSIRMSQSAGYGASSGTGAVVGGVVGGLLGHEVGGGRGKTAATIAGAIGGAMVGNQIEQSNVRVRDQYQVGVRLDNGGYKTVMQDEISGLQVGTRVRIENDRVYRY